MKQIFRFCLMACALCAFSLSHADVGIYGRPITSAWNNDVQAKISAAAAGSLGTVSIMNSAVTPTLADLQAFSSVLVYSDTSFVDSNALGNVLADYVDAGGTVVVATFAVASVPVNGRLNTGGYLPITPSGQASPGGLTLVPVVPASPLLTGVTSLNGGTSSFYGTGALTAGATLVAAWNNGAPLVATKGRVIALNFYPPSSDARPDFWVSSTDGGRLMSNALGMGTATTKAVPMLSPFMIFVLACFMAGTVIYRRI